MENILMEKIFDQHGAVIVCDMDGVLVDIDKPIYDHIINNEIYNKDYDKSFKDREAMDKREDAYVNNWIKLNDNKECENNLYNFIKDIDYSKLYPTNFTYFLIRKLEEDPTKKLYILTRCMEGAHIKKEKYIKDIFFGLEDRVHFLYVSFEKQERKSDAWEQVGIDYDIYIEDELYNIIDMLSLPIIDADKTKTRINMMPMFGYNYLDLTNTNTGKDFFIWYTRELIPFSANMY